MCSQNNLTKACLEKEAKSFQWRGQMLARLPDITVTPSIRYEAWLIKGYNDGDKSLKKTCFEEMNEVWVSDHDHGYRDWAYVLIIPVCPGYHTEVSYVIDMGDRPQISGSFTITPVCNEHQEHHTTPAKKTKFPGLSRVARLIRGCYFR